MLRQTPRPSAPLEFSDHLENGSSVSDPARAAIADLDQHPPGQHAGAQHNDLLRHVGHGLLGMHQQIQEHLLELALRSHHHQGTVGDQVAHADAAHLPLPLAEFDQAAQQGR